MCNCYKDILLCIHPNALKGREPCFEASSTNDSYCQITCALTRFAFTQCHHPPGAQPAQCPRRAELPLRCSIPMQSVCVSCEASGYEVLPGDRRWMLSLFELAWLSACDELPWFRLSTASAPSLLASEQASVLLISSHRHSVLLHLKSLVCLHYHI